MSHGMHDTCTRCHETFPISEFVKDSKRTRGYRRTCKSCHTAEQRIYTEKNADAIKERDRQRYALGLKPYKPRPPRPPKPPKPPLPVEEVRRRGRDYQRLKRIALRGLSHEGYLAMADRQQHLCAICSRVCSSGRDLCIDHDHETGRVRGLLCTRCNLGIGQFHEDITILERAICYLKEHQHHAQHRSL